MPVLLRQAFFFAVKSKSMGKHLKDSDAEDRQKVVQRVLIVTLVLNLFVVVLKAIVGFWTGSLSLQADALHSVTDGANNILGLVTNKLASPHADREHPYGHHKFEAIGALGIAGFLSVACFEIFRNAVDRIFGSAAPVKIEGVELAILLLVLAVNIFVTVYEQRAGKRVQSAILLADAKHTLSDIWITITVLLGLVGIWLGARFNFPQVQSLDLILTFPVMLLVIRSAWQVIRENLPWLVDEMAVAPEAIHEIVMNVEGVRNCHDVASRGLLGRQVFIEMHLIVDAKDVRTAHLITEEVEAKLEEKFAPARILIHIEPPDYESEHISYIST